MHCAIVCACSNPDYSVMREQAQPPGGRRVSIVHNSSLGICADTFQSLLATAGAPGLAGSCLPIHCLPL